jgi:hypothetical protein
MFEEKISRQLKNVSQTPSKSQSIHLSTEPTTNMNKVYIHDTSFSDNYVGMAIEAGGKHLPPTTTMNMRLQMKKQKMMNQSRLL